MANLTFEKANVTRDSANLPAQTIEALISRGWAHYFGNEQAARVTARIKQEVAKESGNGTKAADIERPAVQAFREAHPDLIKEWEADIYAGALKALDDGTIGVRESNGPREATDPVGVEVRKMAKARVLELLKAKGLKFPGKDEKLDLNGATFTGAELIQRQIDRNGDALRKRAEAIVKSRNAASQPTEDEEL